MLIPIVNEKDRIIGYKERSLIDKQKDIYRVSALWIVNEYEEVLLSQRSLKKKSQPGRWGPAVAGTVDKGETYRRNIIKEAREEIGIIIKNPKFYKKNMFRSENSNYFSTHYTAKIKRSTGFILEKNGVKAVKWIDKKSLLRWIADSPQDFVPSMPRHIQLIKDIHYSN